MQEPYSSQNYNGAPTLDHLLNVILSFDNNPIDQWRIQRLVFYILGHYAALHSTSLLDQDYMFPAQFGWWDKRITTALKDALDRKNIWVSRDNLPKGFQNNHVFDSTQLKFISKVYTFYKMYSGVDLLDMCAPKNLY
jgi:hypothetical protein